MNNINNSNKSSRAVACITGASSGIGREIAKLLSKKGYDLILVSRNTKEMLLLSQQLSTRCEIITCDLSDENACIKLGRTLAKKNIYIFINNAGFGDLGSFDKTTHILTKYMVKAFKKRNRGYIMNVASSAGLLPGGPYMSTYYATKSYVTSLTSAINEELREAKSRVHICMLCPGPVNTNFNNVANVTFALPGISATYCASYALRQMFRGKVTIVPTLMMKLGTTVAKCVPRQMVTAITARQQKKKIM